jgi:hypothetical protein
VRLTTHDRYQSKQLSKPPPKYRIFQSKFPLPPSPFLELNLKTLKNMYYSFQRLVISVTVFFVSQSLKCEPTSTFAVLHLIKRITRFNRSDRPRNRCKLWFVTQPTPTHPPHANHPPTQLTSPPPNCPLCTEPQIAIQKLQEKVPKIFFEEDFSLDDPLVFHEIAKLDASAVLQQEKVCSPSFTNHELYW